jgi:hypothetical protein
MVGEDVEPQSQPARRMVAERRAFTGLRDGEEMPLICPTCQLAFEASMPAPAPLHGVVFDILGARTFKLLFRAAGLPARPQKLCSDACGRRERRTMFARSGTAGTDFIAEQVGFKGGRHKPSYRSVTPLDARRLPTFN